MNIQNEIEQITKQDFPAPAPIPFKLLLRPDLKTSDLWVSSPTHSAIKGAAKPYEFPFKSPVLVTGVEIYTENYSSFDSFEIAWKTLNGDSVVRSYEPENGVISIRINELITNFSFKPPQKILPGKKIISIQAEGLDYDALSAVLHAHNNIKTWKQKIVATVEDQNKKLEEIQLKLSQENKQLDAVKSETIESEKLFKATEVELAKTKSLLEVAKTDLTAREEALAAARKEVAEARNATATERTALEDLQGSIASKKAELKSLKEDINLFPTELKSFTEQGSKTAKSYLWLSLAPVLIIAVLAAFLINGAGNLAEITYEKSFSEVIALITSRIPYVTVIVTAIGACYGLAHFLLFEIVKINRQKLNINKISIIATDVSKSAEIDLNDLSEEELYEKRIQFKMALLRDHMKTYLVDERPFTFAKFKKWERTEDK